MTEIDLNQDKAQHLIKSRDHEIGRNDVNNMVDLGSVGLPHRHTELRVQEARESLWWSEAERINFSPAQIAFLKIAEFGLARHSLLVSHPLDFRKGLEIFMV
jgi:hypothetical protein